MYKRCNQNCSLMNYTKRIFWVMLCIVVWMIFSETLSTKPLQEQTSAEFLPLQDESEQNQSYRKPFKLNVDLQIKERW